MKKILVMAFLAMTMFGCGYVDRSCASATGQPTQTCVEGVVYLQFTSGATVKVDIEGKVVTCER